jgi:hypothetical protein
MTVSSRQRFSRDFPCLVCSGYDDLPRGRGMRCHGFLSDDGEWAMCTREEHAGDLERNEAAGTYAHRASGPCGCGKEHAPQAPISLPRAFKLWEFSETYDYQDENGALLFQVVRYPAPWKTFRQRQPLLLDAKPKRRTDWQWDLDGITPVLYRLPQLLAADPGEIVWYPEGEKDVDRLISLGLVATTNPMGAGKWRPHYAEWLKGRDIVLLEDNDAEGRRHGDVVERALVGMARSVKRLRFEDLPEGGDVSDWLDAGHTHEELIELVRPKPALQERVDAAVEEWKRGDVIKVKTLLLMAIPPARWAIDGLLPEGLTLFVGSVKVGKSFGAIGLTVAVTAGGRAFGQIPVQQGPALYLALEDNERRLQERYREVLLGSQAADELYVALEWPRVHEGGLPKLDSWLEEHPDTRLVVVDTLKKIRPPTGERKSVYDADYESLEGLPGSSELDPRRNCRGFSRDEGAPGNPRRAYRGRRADGHARARRRTREELQHCPQYRPQDACRWAGRAGCRQQVSTWPGGLDEADAGRAGSIRAAIGDGGAQAGRPHRRRLRR